MVIFMPHLPIRVRRLLKAGAIFCLSWGSLNAQDPVWQGQKNTKVSDSQQAFCPGPASCGVFFACCCGSWPWWGSCGNRWEVQNSDGGVEDQLQLPGEKKETIKGLEERGVCVCEEMRLKFSAGLLFERRVRRWKPLWQGGSLGREMAKRVMENYSVSLCVLPTLHPMLLSNSLNSIDLHGFGD